MKCSKCEAELEEGVTLCPECGCENAPAEETPAEPAEAASEQVIEEIPAEEPQIAEESGEEEESRDEKEKTPIVEGKLSAGKIALLVALAVAAIAIVVALIVSGISGNDASGTTEPPADTPTESVSGTEATDATGTTDTTDATEATVPADGNPDDVTCKGSYTATDDEVIAAKDTVVARVGDAELTVGELQVYYWSQFYEFMNSYSSYASYFGLDYSQPMDTQLSMDGTTTWQQYFLDAALNAWHLQVALGDDAEAAGFELDEEYVNYLAELPANMETDAATYGFESAQAMIEGNMGKGTDMDAYMSFVEESCISSLYYDELLSQITVTEDEVELYYAENAVSYESNGIEKSDEQIYVDARHILVMPQGGTTDDSGNTTYSEEEWETCRASAQAILDEWKAGDATEATFAALANSRSEDGGSNTNGGLYEDIYEGQMVEPFETWCFDSSRQYGDTGLVQTDYGYHVMYFVGSTPIWYATAESDLYSEKCVAIMDNAQAAHEMTVDYSAIILNTVSFT